jgi:hypothetical protein
MSDMHTDEYTISLSREIKVCESTIKRIRKTLDLFEQKYHIPSERFCKEQPAAETEEAALDFRVWTDTCASLERWQDLERQYRALHLSHKL